MDDVTFDRFAKTLAASSVRRQALRVSIGAVLAAGLGSLAQDAGAKKGKKGKKKTRNGGDSPPPTPPLPPPPGQPFVCRGATETCATGSECCEVELGNVQCKATSKGDCSVGIPGPRCCRNAGRPCTSKCECCDDMVCTGNTCQAPPP